MKAIYDKPITNIILSRGKTEIVSSKVKNGTRVSTVPTVISYSTGIPSQSNKTRERNKRDSTRERKSQIISIHR
jgi:hypothetical protein